MHPKTEPGARRVHGAQIKAKVLAECRQPGASISAVALAHGLNANLVRKWLHGRGLRRVGLQAEAAGAARATAPVRAQSGTLQFVPVELAMASGPITTTAAASQLVESEHRDSAIHVQLRRGSSQVAVKWPAARAAECAAWLRELAAVVLK